MPLAIDIQNHVLVMTTSDGQVATISIADRAPSLRQAVEQFVLEVAALIDGEPIDIVHVNGRSS